MRCAIIDGDFFPYYVLPNKKLPDGTVENKTFEECTAKLDNFIANILRLTSCDSYVIALTLSKCFRYNVDPLYKDNRKALVKPPYFKEFIYYLTTKYNAISHEELEADDLVLIYKNLISDSIIVSPDKDIIKCIEGRHFNPKKNEFVDTSKEEANYNFWKSVITGDVGDNIKGIKNRGEVFATKLLNLAKTNNMPYETVVFSEYINEYKESGIEEFIKNYKCLKILDRHPDFDINKIKLNLVVKKEG